MKVFLVKNGVDTEHLIKIGDKWSTPLTLPLRTSRTEALNIHSRGRNREDLVVILY